jgi:hypothetical protein
MLEVRFNASEARSRQSALHGRALAATNLLTNGSELCAANRASIAGVSSVAFIDDDDLWAPDTPARQLGAGLTVAEFDARAVTVYRVSGLWRPR